MAGRGLLRTVWLLTVVCVVIGSLVPSTSAPIRFFDELNVSDKVLHLGAYLTLMALPAMHENRLVTALLAVGTVALGLLLEYGQRYVPGRSWEVWDMAADTAGVLCGLVAARLLRPKLEAGAHGTVAGPLPDAPV
jgi:VanZ family protein